MKYFKVTTGPYKGRAGVQVGRYCDPSYDDIELMFDSGVRVWFRARDVERAEETESPACSAIDPNKGETDSVREMS
jgi:hypothetical protein